MRNSNQLAKEPVGFFTHPEAPKIELHRPFVENPHDEALAVDHRDDRDPNINLASMDTQLDSTVLRKPLLGNIQLGHNLQTRDDGCLEAIDLRRHRLGL